MAVKRPDGEGGIGAPGTLVGDYGRTIEQEEQEGEADGDNNTGEKCMKLEMERVDEGPVRVIITTATRSLLR